MVQKGGMINILSNRATLYSVFFLSIVYLFFLLLNYDFPSVFFFGLVGLVSSFFTRNMVVVLSISLIVTIILKMGGVLGDFSSPSLPPTSETVVTTEMIIFDEDGNPSIVDSTNINDKYQNTHDTTHGNTHIINDKIQEIHYDEYIFNRADLEIIDMVNEDEPSADELLMIPGYQSSIMLSNDSTLDFEIPIETIPVDMESTYGYEFNNPFSKLGQKCGVSDQYSCFN
jgi:hypothetical protein